MSSSKPADQKLPLMDKPLMTSATFHQLLFLSQVHIWVGTLIVGSLRDAVHDYVSVPREHRQRSRLVQQLRDSNFWVKVSVWDSERGQTCERIIIQITSVP